MKDAFTAALSEVVQHQIEMTSTIDSLLNDQASQQTSSHEVDEVRSKLVQFNAQVSALANRLAACYDENLERPITRVQTDVSST